MWQGHKGLKFSRSWPFWWAFAFFASHSLWPPQFTTKCIQNFHFEAVWVSNFFTWSQSLAICVEVSNWSNGSQSQVSVWIDWNGTIYALSLLDDIHSRTSTGLHMFHRALNECAISNSAPNNWSTLIHEINCLLLFPSLEISGCCPQMEVQNLCPWWINSDMLQHPWLWLACVGPPNLQLMKWPLHSWCAVATSLVPATTCFYLHLYPLQPPC